MGGELDSKASVLFLRLEPENVGNGVGTSPPNPDAGGNVGSPPVLLWGGSVGKELAGGPVPIEDAGGNVGKELTAGGPVDRATGDPKVGTGVGLKPDAGGPVPIEDAGGSVGKVADPGGMVKGVGTPLLDMAIGGEVNGVGTLLDATGGPEPGSNVVGIYVVGMPDKEPA